MIERPKPTSLPSILGHIENHADTEDTGESACFVNSTLVSYFELGRTLLLDFVLLIETIAPLHTHKSHKQASRPAHDPLAAEEKSPHEIAPPFDPEEAATIIRALLGSVLTFGIDDHIDRLCVETLKVKKGPAACDGLFG